MGVIPVQTNDVVFSVHATVFSVITAIQCLIYEVTLSVNISVCHLTEHLIFREETKKYHPTLGRLSVPHPVSFSLAL